MAAMEFPGRQLDWGFDPLEALRRWPLDRRVCLLHSGRLHRRWARWSILAEPVGTYRFVQSSADTQSAEARSSATPAARGGESQWCGPAELCPAGDFAHRPFGDLRRVLAHDATGEALWIGYLSYDLGRWVESLADHTADDRCWPIAELGCCPGYLAYDGVAQRWLACGGWRRGGFPDLDVAVAQRGEFTAGDLRSTFHHADYEAQVARAIEYIAAGDVFQVNLTQRFTADFAGQYPAAHRAAFDSLASISPAWYGAYIEQAAGAGEARRVIASTSPELFLEVDGAGSVVTRPIKGTRPATMDPMVLRRSEKDAAELNMIVDLLRNDLGRVCAYGSVQVTEPRTIETHPTIHHGVATIQGTLHERQDVVDLLRATVPGGSITGAPKVRTMQIIEELEPVRRGPYCGCIGLLSRQQTCLNIAIRTMLLESPTPAPGNDPGNGPGRVDFAVGGGIVADSDPAQEYQETLDKAAAILETLQLAAPE